MAIDPSILRAMQAAGASIDVIIAAVEADAANEEARKAAKRANNAERQRRFKARRKGEITSDNAGNALPDVTNATSPLDKNPPHTPHKINPQDPPIVPPRKGAFPARPEDVSEQVWADWLALRKSKRAPVTPGVIDGARREAAKLGWTLDKTLAEWVFRGSQGFQAEWITPARAPPAEHLSFVDQILAKQKATAP